MMKKKKFPRLCRVFALLLCMSMILSSCAPASNIMVHADEEDIIIEESSDSFSTEEETDEGIFSTDEDLSEDMSDTEFSDNEDDGSLRGGGETSEESLSEEEVLEESSENSLSEEEFLEDSSEDDDVAMVLDEETEPIITPGGVDLTDTGTQWSVDVDEYKTLYGDKYVEEQEGALLANQFTLTLENGLEDREKHEIVYTPAPEPSYIAFLIDQSSSMSQNNAIEGINTGLENFYNAMMAENQSRLQNARDGLYTDIDPDGDVEEQMAPHLMKVILICGFNACEGTDEEGGSSWVAEDNGAYVRFENLDGKTVLSDSDVAYLYGKSRLTGAYNGQAGCYDGGLYGQSRGGDALGYMYGKLQDIGFDQLENAHLVMLSDYYFTDRRAAFGFDSWANIWLFGRFGDDDGWGHWDMKAAQINRALAYARRIKDLGVHVNSIAVNMNRQVDMVKKWLAAGDIDAVNNDWYGGFILTLSSLISSDYPKNSTMATSEDFKDWDGTHGAEGAAWLNRWDGKYDLGSYYNHNGVKIYPPVDASQFDPVDVLDQLGMSRSDKDGGNGGARLFYDIHKESHHTDPRSMYFFGDGYPNRMGVYTKLPADSAELVQSLQETFIQIATGSSTQDSGYASARSMIVDELTMPFEILNPETDIKVFRVPRIPASLDEDGIPTDVDEDGNVQSFIWGEQMYEAEDGKTLLSDWDDITKTVAVNVNGRTVTVSGFDYERNALTTYSKRAGAFWAGDTDRNVYKPGDYGYKLVVQIKISGKETFGGNGIITNRDEGTKFVPAQPGKDSGLPDWKDNTELNPDGNDFISRYPVPEVDLMPTNPYDIVCDTFYVYAPQTIDISNLVTDSEYRIFYNDPMYDLVAIEVDDAKKACEDKQDEIYDFIDEATPEDEHGDRSPMSDDDRLQLAELNNELDSLLAVYKEKMAELQACKQCVPDGLNNQFVDISYELHDPEGTLLGTMFIPHGRSYTGDNIAWDFSPMGGNTMVTLSGQYEVTAVITPVYTDISPNGLIYTDKEVSELPSEDIDNTVGVIPAYLYYSESYSSTGSRAEGTFEGTEASANPEAYLYQLYVLTTDTRLVPRQTVDFNLGTEPLETTENKHIFYYEWVCTDKVTPSDDSREPGITGELKVGLGGVDITSTIPEQAFEDGRAQTINSITATGDMTDLADGWTPVTCTLRRQHGNLNKNVSVVDQVRQETDYMSDSDNIYGNGVSSVVWAHVCQEIPGQEKECEMFGTAKDAYGDTDDGTGDNGIVRYLIHVEDNPKPVISKTTSTPVISIGSGMQWTTTVGNTSEDENPQHLTSDFTLVDVIPWVGDTRIDPGTNREGSDFGGELELTGVTFDMSGASTALSRLEDKYTKIYATSDLAVRTADEPEMMGEGDIAWKEVDYTVDGTTVSVSGLPENCQAVRLDARLTFGESLSMTVGAQVKDPADMNSGDMYLNESWVYNGNGGRNSETVAVKVESGSISGIIWEDYDGDGLIGGLEKKLENITVTLYKEWNPNNPNSPDREVNGTKLVAVYDKDFNRIPSQVTRDDGYYLFEKIQPGTYWVIADQIPENYAPTVKEAGAGNSEKSKIDSQCEETFGTNTDESLNNSAFIQKIQVTGSGNENENFGMKLILGNITVEKKLDAIYYPSGMTDAEKEDYQLVFTFNLKNIESGVTYKRTVRIDGKNITEPDNRSSCAFKKLPIGTYELTEANEAQYVLESFESKSGACTYDKFTKTMTIQVTPDEHEFEITANNKLDKDPPGGDENGVTNMVNVRVPVSLDVTYVGADPITGKELTQYTFVESDFDPAKGGDIVVTYDDGTKISLADGTLEFEWITFAPGTVTNIMNTTKGSKINVSAYYSEKGRTVQDGFRVGVDLKPVHKFQLTFDANGSRFSDESTRNIVNFAYDENAGCNIVTGGDYKDVVNGGLVMYSNDAAYGFAGWNTKYDGSGVNYNSLSALDAIGRDPTISTLTLYAQWTVKITFNANGGTLAPQTGLTTANLSPGERAVVGQGTGQVTYNLNQMLTTGLAGNRTNFHFVLWNTKTDASGIDLTKYGRVTGPETFYATYYQSDYYYTGSPQTFTAPVDGIYRITCYGASGGVGANGSPAGQGGITWADVYLNAGTPLYIYVGGAGSRTYGGWNGGGSCTTGYHRDGGGGGGATDIRLNANLNSRIIVAGGGGGTGSTCCTAGYGGAGGGINGGISLSDGAYAYGGGQDGPGRASTSSNSYDRYGAFGYGVGPYSCAGAGGGGWWGGNGCWYGGGAGGSSYILDYPGCSSTYRALQHSLTTLIMGSNNGSGYSWSIQQGGNSGHGRASIILRTIK